MSRLYRQFDRFPEFLADTTDGNAWEGYAAIAREIRRAYSGKEKLVIALDCYPGVDEPSLIAGLSSLLPALVLLTENFAISKEAYGEILSEYMTEDRVFGRMSARRLEEMFPKASILAAENQMENCENGIVLIVGTGASLLAKADMLIYCDIARWEIQTRYKKGQANWHTDNGATPFLSKYKQGFFFEWRMADRHKAQLMDKMDYLLDANITDCPKMVLGEALRDGLNRMARAPFRLVPYYDPGVWGGQWMKDICGLDQAAPNYAWSFDGVPEENSLYLRFGQVRVEIPAQSLVLYQPRCLLGERVYARFGAEFPIRFDFLDTMGGQNLSLQVHPTTDYIQKTFGMHYTQDESYYFLDCEDDACVYLGLKENVDREAMFSALREANEGGASFDAERYVNKFPVKAHDHVLIPAGTVHCSGANGMVLEISATPYIFTFKLWDWDRLGLDGLPRPVHLAHGESSVDWERTTAFAKEQLMNQERTISEREGLKEEHTGLHPLEFIETRRYTFTRPFVLTTDGGVSMLNLVQGDEIEVYSPDNAFEPFTVHYAETFILPAAAETFGLRPSAKSLGQEMKIIRAYVR